jgi:uncharacterized repeat protein (TIGR03803 family)
MPFAGVVRDSAGRLYGTTSLGGAANAGVVYSLDSADSLTVLCAFAAGADGGYPMAGVFLSSMGKLFGSTFSDGKNGAGVVYEIR